VVEEIPGSERLSLTSMSIDGFLSYASNREIPENVRSALRQAVTLWQEANTAAAKVNEIENDLQRALAEQTRIRDNLTAVGTETEAGAQYLARLREVDTRIDTINAGYDEALGASRSARQAYDDYIAGLEL
jgi:predicted  nucleic acid-binding Zn-ribbon protein